MSDYSHPVFLSQWVWALAGYGCLALWLAWRQWAAHRRALHAGLAQRFGLGLSAWRLGLKLALLLAGGLLLLKALAGPLGRPVEVQADSEGADLILAVDVSASMSCQDVAPTRLGALKQALTQCIDHLDGDRVGLVAFAGLPVVACPLTTDYETADIFLDKLDNDSVPVDGTSLGKALALCLDKFPSDPARGRMIVLATDGEETLDSDMSAEARRAGEAGVPIFTIGVGSSEGAMIPQYTDLFGRVMAKTYHGEPVVSRLNQDTLKRIASLSGGEYFHGASPAALAAAMERLRQLKQSRAKAPARISRELLYQPWLLWALILLLAEVFVSKRPGGLAWAATRVAAGWSWLKNTAARRFRERAALRAAMLILVFFSLTGFSLEPGREEYNQGNQLSRQGKYDEAIHAYQGSIQLSPREPAYYNLGSAYFNKEDYQQALDAFNKAVEMDPKDLDAAKAAELARKKLQQQASNPKDSKQGKDKKKDGQKGNQGQQGGQQNGKGVQQTGQKQGGQRQGGQQQAAGGQNGNGEGNQNRETGGRQKGQAQAGQPAKPAMNADEVQAMMNMLAQDQKRFQGAFQPLKKRDRSQPEDAFDQMFEQMTGMRIQRPNQPQARGDVKDW